MLIPLKDILEKTKDIPNPVIIFHAHIEPKWVARILNWLYRIAGNRKPLVLSHYAASEKDGKLVFFSHWTSGMKKEKSL